MLVVNRLKLSSILDKVEGKFIGVTFIKKDGTIRRLNGRFGVHKYLVGGINKVSKNSNSYLTIYDVKAKGYRTINLDTIQSIRMNKELIEVV